MEDDMEEKKLTDEVVVAKNAITDEEIAKAILQQIEYNAGIPYIDEWLKVKTIKFTDILNFIHRLQAENKELKSPKFASWKLKFFNLKEEFDKELAEHEAFAKKAKAEIERLTEENAILKGNPPIVAGRSLGKTIRGKLLAFDKMKEHNAELQKQVDEFKKENNDLLHERQMAFMDRHQQAVKDTAKEICEFILKYWQGHDLVECDWLRVEIGLRYGVEVE